MTRVLLTALLILAGWRLQAQDFPKGWIGNWQGEGKWYKPGSDTPQSYKMQLRIQPAAMPGQYTWHIIYGEGGKDDRPYLLKPVDTARGHWQVDENNGIVIDEFYIGGRLTCTFAVMNSTITSSAWREGEKLIVEFYTVSSNPLATTGKGTEESPLVKSYRFLSYQRAELRR